MRIAIGIEYDGSEYSGWQLQPHAPSIQETLQDAVAKVANHPVDIICAGRTDAGVHALGQVGHFDTDAVRSERSWVLGVNSNLPKSINILWAREMPADFHARFSAIARSYRYIILNRWIRSAVHADRVTWCYRPLDADRMHQAAQQLLGEHDFSSFRAVACQSKTAIRNIEQVSVRREGNQVILDIRANAFLHHMVRNIAGVLMSIGKGEHPPEWVNEVLAARDREQGGVTAAPHGLYFMKPHYPQPFELPDSVDWLTGDDA
jgi:tRNA pseudouridine38-40 synthase